MAVKRIMKWKNLKMYERKCYQELVRDNPYCKMLLVIIEKKLGHHFNHNNHYNFLARLLKYDNLDIFNLYRKINYYFNGGSSEVTKQNREMYIFKYGTEEGLRLYGEYLIGHGNRVREGYASGARVPKFDHFFPEFYIEKGYSEEEALAIVQSRKTKAAENSHEVMRQSPEKNPTNIAYYLAKGMNEEESKEALSNRQRTFTLEKCIEKHGEEEGTRIWQERQDKWQATLKSKSPEEIQEINRKKVVNSRTAMGTSSTKEKELIAILSVYYNIDIEQQFYIADGDIIRTYDGKYKNVIIEFHGTYWHCDPRVFPEDYFHETKKVTAKELWEYDEQKRLLAEKHGYTIFVVWENDFKTEEDKLLAVERFKEYV